VKFTTQGLVSLAVAKNGSEGDLDRLRFTVTDTGVGIPPEAQAQLFQPFSQADASITRRFGGTGLGLSISRRLVELMGGRIGLTSQAGSGSSFWFELVLPQAERPAELEERSRGPEERRGGLALVAEDLPMNQELARAMLRRAGWEADVVPNGEEAVRAVSARRYDLVLMDIQMPIMDGITATRRIRELPTPAGEVPIVAMTANVLPQQVSEFLAVGMTGHVAKPVRQRELETALAAAVPSPRRAAAETAAQAAADDQGAFDASVFASVQDALPHERLKEHVADFGAQLDAVAGASGESDRTALRFDAHKIVSQAGMLGLMRLSGRARELEQAAAADDGIEPALARFREAVPDLERHIAPLMAR
jgi:CheY-like chemotaxis protein